jgi:DNA polymerase-1
MLVTREEFDKVVERLSVPGWYGYDTETMDRGRAQKLFSVQIAVSETEAYHFNFLQYPEDWVTESMVLPRAWIKKLQPIVGNPESTLCIQNAKFDMRMSENEGLDIKARVWCTLALARVLQNNHMTYDLDSQAKRIGLAKNDEVDKYLKAHGHIEKLEVPGKKKKVDFPHFERVPLDIMERYGTHDAFLHKKIAQHQAAAFMEMNSTRLGSAPDMTRLIQNEIALTKVCAAIESVGMKINRPYVEAAMSAEMRGRQVLAEKFKSYTGLEFSDSNKLLADAFTKMGEKYPTTAKGNPSFKDEVLAGFSTPVAQIVRDIRSHDKLIGTYYSSFLYFADEDDILRANMRQGGTETGRFSYSDPNLQNLPKEDEEEDLKKPFLVRSSFMPRPGFCFVMIDYSQQEFRMMLDYAGELELIEDIMKRGVDVHQATAEFLGITRKQAKTINFGLLYGMGIEKLARALKVSVPEADRLKGIYFSKLPRIRAFINTVARTGKDRGYIWNWAGRRCHISSPDFAYVLPNHLIQGGGADVVKFAMVEIHELLRGYKSRMVCQVHDEILFEIHESELHLVPKLKAIMERIYRPRNGMFLTCSVEHSWKSWGTRDKIKGAPSLAA